jgi:hypothetical protein
MRKPTSHGVTPVYARQRSGEPTFPQQSAIDLLASGKTDKETAELLNLDRTTVTKWRLYDPVFQGALNRRRSDVWSAGIDRLRSLIPKALDALAEAVEDRSHPHRIKAAVELLRLVPITDDAFSVGPTAANDIVRRIVEQRRSSARGVLDELAEDGRGLPPFDEHMEQVRGELEVLAADASPKSPAPATCTAP